MNDNGDSKSGVSPDISNEQSRDPFSENELQEVRKRTFNTELSGLIEKISGDDRKREIQAPDTDPSIPDPVKRINTIIYKQYARSTGGEGISAESIFSETLSLLEYELQRLNIGHYALFSYSERDECFRSYHSVFIDTEYIGIYREELSDAVNGRWSSYDNRILISLSSLLNKGKETVYTNTLLPLILFECDSWSDESYDDICRSSLAHVLISHEYNRNSEQRRKNLIRHTVHTELVRLQHTYTLIPESVCYVLCSDEEKNLNSLNTFRSEIDGMREQLSHTSSVYMFNGITAVLFLHGADINLFHNLYLQTHERSRSIVLFDLEDFRGRNFVSTVYSAACGQYAKCS